MEVKAFCSGRWVNVILLFAIQTQKCYFAEKADAGFPHFDPSRLQFFEYESIQFKCNNLDFSSEWRVMRKLRENTTNALKWETSTGSFNIRLALASDSGEYWCENDVEDRTSSVNITVTTGNVILEGPIGPVTEGDSVSLTCRKKMAVKNLAAEFFKDDKLITTGYKGEFLISNVSKSHEGLYKCSISGAGESEESWLSVKDLPATEIQDQSDGFSHYSLVLLALRAFLVLAGLLLIVGLLCRLKNKDRSRTRSAATRDKAVVH